MKSSRRKFLKGVGIAGAGAALADHLLLEPKAQKSNGPETLSGATKITLDVNSAPQLIAPGHSSQPAR
jgi:hypothetical protein